MKQIISFLLSFVLLTNLFAQPAISSFSPASGAIGSNVTITGKNFNKSVGQNIVFFGATRARVIAVTASSLTVTVPSGATYQYISVTDLAKGLTAYSTKPFIIKFAGGITFTGKTDLGTGSYPYSVSINDIDGDGKADVAVVNSSSNTVSVFRNTSTAGSISFAAKVDFITGNGPALLATGDLNGDGKVDLAVANQGTSTISVLRNTSTPGAVSFATKVDFATGSDPYSVSIGDIDGDGRPDLAVANVGSQSISVLRNTSIEGSVSFAAKIDVANTSYPVSISMGDIDGDGKPDLAVANNGSQSVTVLRNTSTPGLISFAAKIDFTARAEPRSVSIGDIDGDGKADLAVLSQLSNKVSLLRNTSSPGFISFEDKVDFVTGKYPVLVSMGDIDGDGKADLVTANFNDSTVSVLRNTSIPGAVSFEAKKDFATGSMPNSVSIGDIDGDGKPDLAIANFNSNTVSVIKQCGLPYISSISMNGQTKVVSETFNPIMVTATGTGLSYQWYKNTSGSNSGGTSLNIANGAQTSTYNPQATAAGSLYYYCIVTGECGTSQTTVVSGAFIVVPPGAPTISNFIPARAAIGNTVTITGSNFNTGSTQNIVFFGATRATVKSATATSLTVTVPMGATYQYISVTNLSTGLTGYSAKPFIVYLSGSFNFTPKADYATGLRPFSVITGDLDGDGKADIAVTNNLNNTVSILRNTSAAGTVSFAKKVDFTTGKGPISVSIGDIDGDGKPDLVAANNDTSTVSVLRNTSTTGNISFAAKVDLTTGSHPVSISIGDLDGDGKPDLAVANLYSNTVSLLQNTSAAGNISFKSKMDLVTGTNPYSISIGDIDGDGKPDLAVANNGSNTVSIFRNTSAPGTGIFNFVAKADFSTGSAPFSVSMGDIDGDGKADLAVANAGSNTVSVLRNTSAAGAISFASKVDFATGSYPRAVSITDINGDGKADLAVVNYSSNMVSVLQNTSTNGVVSFATKVDFATGASPVAVSIGDLDGDGKPDLAIANNLGNTLSIIRQLTVAPFLRTKSNGFAAKLSLIEEKTGFAINPNPVESSHINVLFKNQPSGRYSLRVVNNIGQTVFTGILQHAGGNSTQLINLPMGIAKGIYQAELHGIKGILGIEKIIINTKN